jgi:carbonic anhydrase
MTGVAASPVRDISKLFDGIRRFRAEQYENGTGNMRDLVEHGQSPAVLMISCCDSRVDPALLTGAAPGELFSLRNIANLVQPYQPGASLQSTGAAIEYAVRDLKVDHIVILGHGHCGGMKALLNAAEGNWPDRDFIGDWVAMALGACKHYVHDEDADGGQREVPIARLKANSDLVERASILGSMDNLMTYPWLAERVEAGNLVLHGWWFDIESGDLWATEPGRKQLLPVD